MTQDQYFRVVGWEDFQHYKDRDPPWIKLHRRLLDNYGWGQLRDVAKGHLVGIWLLAARHDNKLPRDARWVAQRIGAGSPVNLGELTAAGFIEPWLEGERTGKREDWPSRHIPKATKAEVWERDGGLCRGCAAKRNIEYDHIVPISKGGTSDVSNIQLLCRKCNRKKRNRLQAAERSAPQGAAQKSRLRSLEAEAETETETKRTGGAFEAAWAVYPKRPNNSKASARRAWMARVKAGVSPAVMLDGATRYAAFIAAQETDPKFVKLGSTFFGPDEHYLNDYTIQSTGKKVQTYVNDDGVNFTPEFLRAAGMSAPR